jgi:hypothetical protein
MTIHKKMVATGSCKRTKQTGMQFHCRSHGGHAFVFYAIIIIVWFVDGGETFVNHVTPPTLKSQPIQATISRGWFVTVLPIHSSTNA